MEAGAAVLVLVVVDTGQCDLLLHCAEKPGLSGQDMRRLAASLLQEAAKMAERADDS
jgi:hypothetical protein